MYGATQHHISGVNEPPHNPHGVNVCGVNEPPDKVVQHIAHQKDV